MKAKSLGIIAQDYENDKVANIDDLYKGIRILDKCHPGINHKLYELPEGVSHDRIQIWNKHLGHQFYIMKNNGSSALGTLQSG